MVRENLILDIFDELIVDNFAGGGGASTGIELALGRHVDHAINHSREALGMHRINHPQTIHHCEDIFDVDPWTLVEGRKVGLGWFSPDCKHFSKAKGGKPLDKYIRGLLYVMFRWAVIKTRVISMENVEEIKTLGPIFETHSNGCKGCAPVRGSMAGRGSKGRACKKGCHFGRPIPEHKGRGWKTVLDILGPGVRADNPDLPEILHCLNFGLDADHYIPEDVTLMAEEDKHKWECDGCGSTWWSKRGGKCPKCSDTTWGDKLALPPSKKQPPSLVKEIKLSDLKRGFGYVCETRELRACDFGAPTIRKRLFMVARCDGKPIVWPAATHSNPKAKIEDRGLRMESRKLKPWRTIAECIDWERPCPSIFLNKAQAKAARCRRPLAKSTLKRIATGIDRYVLKAKEPFLVSLTHQGGDRVEAVSEPAKTLTGAHRGEKALVEPEFANGESVVSSQSSVAAPVLSKFHGDHAGRSDGAQRGQGVEEPLKTQDVSNRFAVTEAKLVAPVLTREFGQSIGQRADDPAPTVMPHGQGKTSLVETKLAPFITEHANASNQRNVPVDQPAPTLCAEVKGGHYALVAGSMVQTGYGEAEGQKPRALDIEKPLGTVVSGGKHAVVTGTLVGAGGRAAQSRPRGVDEPNHTATAKADQVLAAASLIKLRGSAETHDKPKSADEPIDAISAGGTHHAVVAGTLVHVAHGEEDKDGNKRRGRGAHDLTEPMPTVVASNDGALAEVKLVKTGIDTSPLIPLPDRGGEGERPAALSATEPSGFNDPDRKWVDELHKEAAFMIQNNNGFNRTPHHPVTKPCSTVTGSGSGQALVAGSLAAYYGNDEDGQAVNEPGRTVTTKERFGLVESTLEEAEGAEAQSGAMLRAPSMTEEQLEGARRVAEFLRDHGVVFEGEFATVAGIYVIVDIGMRMLTARELFRAQGFPNEYVIDKAVVVDPATGDSVTVTLTKEQQIRMCGNSVCPPVADAIIRANVPELAIWGRKKPKPKLRESVVVSEFQDSEFYHESLEMFDRVDLGKSQF